MKLTKLKPFCLDYFCVLRNRPTRPWPSVGRFAACWILKISRRLANRAAVNLNARAFKFVLLGNLVSLLVTKMIKTSSHLIFTEYQIIYLTYHDGEFWPFSKANYQKVGKSIQKQSTGNLSSRFHLQISAIKTGGIDLLQCAMSFWSSLTSLHRMSDSTNRPNIVPNNWWGQQSACLHKLGWFLSWNVNVKLMAWCVNAKPWMTEWRNDGMTEFKNPDLLSNFL